MDHQNDENQIRFSKDYEPGVWYYTGFPMTDHSDFAGIPSTIRFMHILLGNEYRPQYYINLYNRIRSLEFKNHEH